MEDFLLEPSSIGLGSFMEFRKQHLNSLKMNNKLSFSISELTDYIELIMLNKAKGLNQVLHLPSLESLAQYFSCSCLDIHDAFTLLRRRGYEHEFTHINEPMRVWKKAD